MHLREVSAFDDDSVTQYNSSDNSAPTTMHQKDSDSGVIEIFHRAPTEPVATDLTYRDPAGRLHEVKVIDRPTDDVAPGRTSRKDERQAKALSDLQAPETPSERPEWI